MKYLQLFVSNQTLSDYIKNHNNTKLDKFISLYTYNGFQKIMFESFDKIYQNTEYKMYNYIYKKEFSNYGNGEGYQIFFKTDSNNEYKIDLIPIKNYNNIIKSDFVWNIAFTLSNRNVQSDSYEELTNLHEEKEVLLRVGDILDKINIPKYFAIGNTIDPRKINLYKHILMYVFKDYKVDLSYCECMFDDKAIYIFK